jgi:ribonuclease Z
MVYDARYSRNISYVEGAGLKITFLGTGAGGSFVADRGGAAVMIEHSDTVILVDCGPGADRRISLAGVQYLDIDAIFITHLHYDHVIGIPELLGRFGRRGGTPPSVFGPSGIDDFIDLCKPLVTSTTPAGVPPEYAGEVVESGKIIDIAGIRAESIEVQHDPSLQAFSWRFDVDGFRVVVSGDLNVDSAVMQSFAQGADLLVHEVYSETAIEKQMRALPTEYSRKRAKESFRPTHSEVNVVAQLAKDSRVKMLAMTHLLPTENESELEEAAGAIFTGDSFVAQPGQTITLD